MIMKTAQNKSAFAKKSLQCLPVIPRSIGRSTPVAIHDDASDRGIQSLAIARANREAGSMLYELLGMAELMRVAYEKGDLAIAQNRLEIIMQDAAALSSTFSTVLEYTRLESKLSGTSSACFDIVALLQEVSHAAR